MIDAPEAPLITFAVFAYGQERFIREAIEGAFAQTYSPLEIVLSDDSSPDGTFEIMKHMAAEYRGPHRVLLNRNEPNEGLAGHINRVVDLSRGELIVVAAGDDISLPQRTEVLFREWENEGRKPRSIYSNSHVLSNAGKRLFVRLGPGDEWHATSVLQATKRMAVAVSGATHAFSREVFTKFGPMPRDCFFEDEMIGFRSLLLAPLLYIPKPLVLYREHPQNSLRRNKEVAINLAVQAMVRSWLRDLERARELGCIPADTLSQCVTYLRDHQAYLETEASVRHESVAQSVGRAVGALRRGARSSHVIKAFYRCCTPTSIRNLRKVLGDDLLHPTRIVKLIKSRIG